MTKTAWALAGLMVMAGCAGPSGGAREDARLQKIYAVADAKYDAGMEAEVLSASHGRASRKGDDLLLNFANGKSLTLHSDIQLCQEGSGACHGYNLVADLPNRHFYLVEEYHYEGVDYWLIDDRTGRRTEIESVPIFSPDGSRFLVQNDDEASDHDNNLEIWRRDGDSAVIEWAHPTRQASMEYSSPVLYHTRVINWRDGRIDLAFGGDAQMDRQTRQIVYAHSWMGTITHDDSGWRLQADWPKSADHP